MCIRDRFRIMNNASAHEMDSSLVLWNKRKLGRATEILRQLATTFREELFKNVWGDKVRLCLFDHFYRTCRVPNVRWLNYGAVAMKQFVP